MIITPCSLSSIVNDTNSSYTSFISVFVPILLLSNLFYASSLALELHYTHRRLLVLLILCLRHDSVDRNLPMTLYCTLIPPSRSRILFILLLSFHSAFPYYETTQRAFVGAD